MSKRVKVDFGLKKKEKLRVETYASDPTVIMINGKKYCGTQLRTKKVDGVIHIEKTVFNELNEEQYKKDIDLITNTLKNRTSSEELLREMFKEISPRFIKRLAKRIRANKPIRKQHGCLGFKIGDAYLQLVGGFEE